MYDFAETPAGLYGSSGGSIIEKCYGGKERYQYQECHTCKSDISGFECQKAGKQLHETYCNRQEELVLVQEWHTE